VQSLPINRIRRSLAARPRRQEDVAMPQTAVQDSMFGLSRIKSPPSTSEIDAMLNEVNVQWIQHDLAPETSLTPEAAWTIAAVTAGGAAGCLGTAILIGSWLASLAAGLLGAAAGGMFAVLLWRASDDAPSQSAAAAFGPGSKDDDLLSGW
jgi:hypothetical protein